MINKVVFLIYELTFFPKLLDMVSRTCRSNSLFCPRLGISVAWRFIGCFLSILKNRSLKFCTVLQKSGTTYLGSSASTSRLFRAEPSAGAIGIKSAITVYYLLFSYDLFNSKASEEMAYKAVDFNLSSVLQIRNRKFN